MIPWSKGWKTEVQLGWENIISTWWPVGSTQEGSWPEPLICFRIPCKKCCSTSLYKYRDRPKRFFGLRKELGTVDHENDGGALPTSSGSILHVPVAFTQRTKESLSFTRRALVPLTVFLCPSSLQTDVHVCNARKKDPFHPS
jgi:hypothetical protein